MRKEKLSSLGIAALCIAVCSALIINGSGIRTEAAQDNTSNVNTVSTQPEKVRQVLEGSEFEIYKELLQGFMSNYDENYTASIDQNIECAE